MFDWDKYTTAELCNALETLDAEASILTAAIWQSKRENWSGGPALGIRARRKTVHDRISAIKAEVERRGERPFRERVNA